MEWGPGPLLCQASALAADLRESLEEGPGALTGFRAAALYRLVQKWFYSLMMYNHTSAHQLNPGHSSETILLDPISSAENSAPSLPSPLCL